MKGRVVEIKIEGIEKGIEKGEKIERKETEENGRGKNRRDEKEKRI